MADEVVPEDLRDFITRYIDSIAQLEALLLLRNNPDERWDIRATASRLYTSEQEAREVLTRLCADGLVTCDKDIYSYGAGNSELAAIVDRLADAYTRLLIPVTKLIHAKPARIRQFADAFKFRKDR